MAVVYDFNTAIAELNAMRDFPSFIQTVSDAYAYSIGPLFPLIVLALVAIATYGKTQNIGTTVVAITIGYVLMYPYIADQLGIYLQIVFGLVVLAGAYVVWAWLMQRR